MVETEREPVQTASAIVTFQSSGTIEVRAEPNDHYQLELRAEGGSTRTPVHEWLVGERPTAVQVIRYHRGEAVEERRVARGGASRIDVADLADTLRLRATSPVGPPAILELRILEAIPPNATVPGLGLPPLPSADALSRARTPSPRTAAPRPKGTINDLIGAIDRKLAQRLQPVLDKICAVELHLEGAESDALIGASHQDHTDPVAKAFGEVRAALAELDAEGLNTRIELLAEGLEQLQGGGDVEAVTARLDALASQLGGKLDSLERAMPEGAGEELAALTAGIEQAFEALAARIPPATDLSPVAEHLSRLTERMPRSTDTAGLEAGLAAVTAAVNTLTEDQFDPVLLVEQLTRQLSEVVKNTQDAGFEPLLVGLDRAEQDRARLGERVGELGDRLVAAEDRLGEAVREHLARNHSLLERVHGVVSGPSTEANRLIELTEQLRRLERAMVSAPSMDGKLTALSSQLRRIEETAGAITPEVFEIIAARLEAVDPRPSFAATADRVEMVGEALEEALGGRIDGVADRVEAKLESRLGEATPLAGRLARLEQAVAELPGTQWVTQHLMALADALADVDRATDATLGQMPPLTERIDALATTLSDLEARPAVAADLDARLSAIDARLGALLEAEALQARLDAATEKLDALLARPTPTPVDPSAALETLQDGLDRLERRVRNEGNQADRAMAAAVAAMRAVGNDDQFEAIEERLVRMERALGGVGGAALDPELVARFEAAAAKAADAPADGEMDHKLEIITGQLRTLTTRPMPVPAPDPEISDRLDALAAQVGALAVAPAAVMPPDFAERLAQLNARLDAQLDAGPDAALLARLDALAARLEAAPAPVAHDADGHLADRVEALAAQVAALAARPVSTPPAAVGLTETVEALAAQVAALAERPVPAPAPAVDPLLLEQLAALGDRIDALTQAQAGLGARIESVSAGVQALELSHPMPATPVPPPVPAEAADDGLVLDFDDDDDDFEIEIGDDFEIEAASVVPRPEVQRRSADGAMLDQIELLIDVVHTQHVDQASVRGVLGPVQLDAIAEHIGALQAALGEAETGSAGRLLIELADRIESSRIDPLLTAQSALIEGDFASAVEKVVEALKADEQAPLTGENVERTLVGVATALWDADPAWFEHVEARPALDTLLAALQVALVVPEANTSWQPKDQRVQARRPGQAGQALNRILEVNAPGFRRGDEIIEKAAVTISD